MLVARQLFARQLVRRSPIAGSRCRLSTAAEPMPEGKYPRSLSYLHWLMAGGFIANIGLVKVAQDTTKGTEGDKKKAQLMMLHKSIGLVLLGAIAARIGVRLLSKMPAHVPGPWYERVAGSASHAALYGTMIILPGSGVAMGYFGGRGLPFFGAHIPGKAAESRTAEDGALAKTAYKTHMAVGTMAEVLIPLHIGAVGYHLLKGHNLLKRFAK